MMVDQVPVSPALLHARSHEDLGELRDAQVHGLLCVVGDVGAPRDGLAYHARQDSFWDGIPFRCFLAPPLPMAQLAQHITS
jgi:hypothetical protein